MQGRVSRRSFLKYTTASGAAPALAAAAPAAAAHNGVPPFRFEEATIAELQRAMAAGSLTSRQLTRAYLRRIRQIDLSGIQLNSVIEVNPDALEIAAELDAERRRGHVRGPLRRRSRSSRSAISRASGLTSMTELSLIPDRSMRRMRRR